MDVQRIQNNQGKRFYGIHFYPGVAQYQDSPNEDPYRVFLNEDTLRRMDKSFECRPIFVDHVEAVDDNLDRLRGEADGWVVRSFYNETDGKHWVEFLITSELGEKAIKQGMRLSNAYVPKAFKTGGLWNGVPYEREIVDAEYEHLAIVENPRYEESVIMTPEQFKAYNEKHAIELKRIANSTDKGVAKMKLNFFKRSKVETSLDPDTMVTLPNSKKEVSILKLVNDADDAEKKKDKKENAEEADKASEGEMARPDHLVTTHKGEVMNVADLVKAHADVCNELDDMKKGDDEGDKKKENADDEDKKKENAEEEEKDKKKNDDDDSVENAEDEEKKKKENADAAEKELEAAKKKNAADKARRLKNSESEYIRSYQNSEEQSATVELPTDRLARGKARYGAN